MRTALADTALLGLLIVLGLFAYGGIVYPPLADAAGLGGMLALVTCIVAALCRRPGRD